MVMLRIDQPTPCGGAYSELYYLDDPTNQKSSMITVIVKEFDASGKILQETVGKYMNSQRV